MSLASQGKRVAVVERRNLAGSCLTIACAPSKNIIHAAKVANYFRRGAEFGIAAGDWTIEMPSLRDRKRKMRPMAHIEALELDSVPKQLLVWAAAIWDSKWPKP